jgi:hypothetical protein
MVVAKSRLQKVPNVRQLLHGNQKPTMMQKLHAVKEKVQHKKAHFVNKVKKKVQQMTKPKINASMAAVENIKELQKRHVLYENKMKGPSRPPPPPPSKPHLNVTQAHRVPPRIPIKPDRLRGAKISK